MRKRTDGFTLVELMVVVLIIGILVAVAVPVFNAAKRNAEKNTCQANQVMIIKAIEAWNMQNPSNLYVTAWYQTDVPPYGGEDPRNFTNTCSPIVPNMLKSAPKCPSKDAIYLQQYRTPGDYALWQDRFGYHIAGDCGGALGFVGQGYSAGQWVDTSLTHRVSGVGRVGSSVPAGQ